MTHLDACLSCEHCTVDHARPERSLCRANVVAVGNGHPAAAYCVDTIERDKCSVAHDCVCCGDSAFRQFDGQWMCDDCGGHEGDATGTCECGQPTYHSDWLCRRCVEEFLHDERLLHCDQRDIDERKPHGRSE